MDLLARVKCSSDSGDRDGHRSRTGNENYLRDSFAAATPINAHTHTHTHTHESEVKGMSGSRSYVNNNTKAGVPPFQVDQNGPNCDAIR